MNHYMCCIILNLLRYCTVCFCFYIAWKMIESGFVQWIIFVLAGAWLIMFGGYSVSIKTSEAASLEAKEE